MTMMDCEKESGTKTTRSPDARSHGRRGASPAQAASVLTCEKLAQGREQHSATLWRRVARGGRREQSSGRGRESAQRHNTTLSHIHVSASSVTSIETTFARDTDTRVTQPRLKRVHHLRDRPPEVTVGAPGTATVQRHRKLLFMHDGGTDNLHGMLALSHPANEWCRKHCALLHLS